ncbi:DNA-directed RNA polymerase subunit beta' [Listeria phage LPJP1]|nr:DNA-directed RNA polymerase subunit beta' [Listeria phage LPJP1]
MTRVRIIDFRELIEQDKIITNHEPVTKKEKKYSIDGIFSEEIYGPEVERDNIDNFGYVDFKNNYVVNPIMFDRLIKLFDGTKFIDMIMYNKRIDANGNIVDLEDEEGSEHEEFEDRNIGLDEFKERFIELLQKYVDTKQKNSLEYKRIIRWYFEGLLFIDCLPIFSPKLRPAQLIASENLFRLSEINNDYNFLINHTNMLKDIVNSDEEIYEDIKIQKLKLQYRVQIDVLKIVDSIIKNNIKGKRGTIRKQILGTRINYSARNVISPDPLCKMDEVYMNYITFHELYKGPLINLISTSENISLVEAEKFHIDTKNTFNKKMYRYMEELINKTEGGLYIILNRNPSISTSSILLMNIAKVKKDISDKTLSLCNNVLAGLGGDYDGDVLNIIALFSKEQVKEFEKIKPSNLIISVNNGDFNRDYGLDKDTLQAAYLLNN